VVQPADLARQLPTPSPSSAESSEHPSELGPRSASRSSSKLTPPGVSCHQSVVANTDAKINKTLLVPDASQAAVQTGPPTATDYFGGPPANSSASMLHRKIWVKRPSASATLVQIREDDLVDDVRDMILKKYSNSLGRSFDAPDVTLRIVPRDSARGQDRTLGPEEEMCRTLDAYFPGGQLVTDALVIDVPQRRTPKPSPQVPIYYKHHDDHTNHQTEYFPPMPVVNPSPAAMGGDPRLPLPHAHSIAVINTGQLPPLPSPGGRAGRGLHSSRPKYPRHNTASPTTLAGGIPSSATSARPPNRPRHDSSASDTKHSATSNNPIPTPPVPVDASTRQSSNPPTPRVASPQPNNMTKKRRKKQIMEPPSLSASVLDGSVPPINVLIVEDNIINLRVLGAFMQRLKVRWQRAMNGKEAVTKWKAGGFHLVLMDIQLPVMNGLEATKEIRRLERVNSIGVFSSASSEAPNTRLGQDGNSPEEPQEDDKLGDKGLFKSPVIIVALTASSLQSDRHEALAAGCNDFLTKVCGDALWRSLFLLIYPTACQLRLA
jgi:osomolarity two-component system response regulator SSK1